jgi:hypothetical protein
MAFNPFHGFRKHQKTIFAILVIICMFVFILQFGAGDVFTRALGWFGAGRSKGTVVATLNGTKVYEPDLRQLYQERDMANFVVVAAASLADANPPEDRTPRQTLAQMIVLLYNNRQFRLPPFGRFDSNEELLDFMVWRAKADKLGIILTEADVRKLVNRIAGKDVFGGKPFTSSELITRLVRSTDANRRGRAISADDLLRALTDEFRVVLAQEFVLGHGAGVFGGSLFGAAPESAQPAATTGEFLQYYRDQRATLAVWMLPLNVNDYLAEAKKKPLPSEKELKDLFDRYKGDVPTPTRVRPAFKEPERVKAEWVVASRDMPYFKDLVRLRVELPEAFTKLGPRGAASASIGAQIGFAATGLGPIGSAAPWLALSPAPISFDRTLPRYADFLAKQTGIVRDRLSDYSVMSPRSLSLFVARALTAPNPDPGAAALPALALSWAGTAAGAEAEETNRVLSTSLTLLANVGAPALGRGLVPPIGGLAYRSPVASYWEMRARLLEELKEEELINPTSGVVTREMEDFEKELAKLKGKPDEANKLIADTIKKYGLRHVAMTTVLDRYQLEKDDKFDPEKDTDSALKKLRDDYLAAQFNKEPSQFADYLLSLKAPYESKNFRNRGDVYAIWQTEFVKAREHKSLAEARDKVVDAVYLEEARTLARAQAEEWSNQARKWRSSLSVAEVERRLREASKKEGFTLDNVARLVSQSAVEAREGKTYAPYAPPASRIAYPKRNLVDQLVKQLKEPGDTTVISDEPERNFYVAVLESRNDQTDLGPFLEVLKDTPARDTLWSRHFLPARRREWEKAVIKQLRLDAGAILTEDGDYKLPGGIRDPGASGSGD